MRRPRDRHLDAALRARSGIEAFGLVIALLEAATIGSPKGQRAASRIIRAAKAASLAELAAMDRAIASIPCEEHGG